MAPVTPPAAMGPNSRFPCDGVNTAAMNSQNCTTTTVPRKPVHT